MINSEISNTDTHINLEETKTSTDCNHDLESKCMKLFISHVELQIDFDENSDSPGRWQVVFYLQHLTSIKRNEIAITLACTAKSIFKLLYQEAECVGNKIISFRVIHNDFVEKSNEINQLFTLSLMNENEEDSALDSLDDRAISHSYALLSEDLLTGSLYFNFNEPQVEQLEKITRLLMKFFPPPKQPDESWYTYAVEHIPFKN